MLSGLFPVDVPKGSGPLVRSQAARERRWGMNVLPKASSTEAEATRLPPGADSTPNSARSGLHPKFVGGSILRHTLVMTGTGAIGSLSIFMVDLLSLLYVSWLGRTDLKAAVGFATQVLLYPVAVNIGLTIAITAAVSRILGAGDRAGARRIATSGLLHVAVLSGAVAALALILAGPFLHLLGARGSTFDLARTYLFITLPGNVPFALGMAFSGLLRAVGDARRSMYVTLAGALVTALIDPLLIFGLGLGIDGAAISTVVARLVFLVVGWHGAARVHHMVERPRPRAALRDTMLLMSVAVPAVMTNLATPVGNGYALHVYARFGDSAVAASAMIDRVVYVSFAVVFALTGAVGPIIGQNLGAERFDRVRETLTSCFLVTGCYALAIWAVLAVTWPTIAVLFQANLETAAYLAFFCRFGVSAWLFIGLLFVANAAFNNLGFPILSMLFNWGRATLGTIPFVTLGAAIGGVQGGQLGVAAGAAIFGTAALGTAYIVVRHIAVRSRSEAG